MAKDIVANRRRLGLGTKLRLAGLALRENGIVWTALIGAYFLTRGRIAERAFAAAERRRRTRGLPGMNSAAMNRLIWENWDWSARGEEWTPSPEWKAAIVATFLEPNVPPGAAVLEVGPGGGRWTEMLLTRAGSLVGIDISEACVATCRERFAAWPNARFAVGAGGNLPGVADASIDAVWSFDVFVHINEPEFAAYAREFARVLKPGGSGIVHHARDGDGGGWRSNVGREAAAGLFAAAGLIVVDQRHTSGIGAVPATGLYDDDVTVFAKQRG
ncbi:MAG: class I SAM-dependent methyltransferase [Bauldia sp.]|nr:class I SAM-dependent methyltransferase [Bauldia sp.]